MLLYKLMTFKYIVVHIIHPYKYNSGIKKTRTVNLKFNSLKYNSYFFNFNTQ